MATHKQNVFSGTGTSPVVSREGTAGPYTYRGHVASPRDIVAGVHARLAALGRLPEPADDDQEVTGG